MREVFEKIVDSIEKERVYYSLTIENTGDKILDVAYEKVGEAIENIIKIVKQAAAEYNNGWIPCSERLPEKKGKYLTTSKIYFVPDHVDEPDNYIGLEITYYSEINGWNGEVIAWQPLPAHFRDKE